MMKNKLTQKTLTRSDSETHSFHVSESSINDRDEAERQNEPLADQERYKSRTSRTKQSMNGKHVEKHQKQKKKTNQAVTFVPSSSTT